jgi:hypothetical protein
VFRHTQSQFQQRSQEGGQGFVTPQCQVIQRPNNFQTPTTRNQSAQRLHAAQNPSHIDRRCYTCGEKGHFANQCPNSCPRANQPLKGTLVPTRGANSIHVAAKENYARGRVNHVAVEEAREAPDVVLGMFLINATTVIIVGSRIPTRGG